ncbi:signal peptide peptidase SppA [Tianweitania sp. BSSL-BM11]|uniref:Signal peptide peptidase SppA n=1 Tax=Tianweitania aestuarii TaxID=2814886 RepID=A0ABS5RQ53_9HYPH|nr:signal peptide peptidase SppA [Tianweitania aestuarii]MBS9719166.1 signal peptide peptidase SppA [Tianweitania aestuarii]
MASRADDLIDRRRLRRKLSFWRIATIVILAAVVFAGVRFLADDSGFTSGPIDQIAKVKIEGTITEDDELLERLDAIRTTASVKGVIVNIDSPGGTTAGGEAIYEEIRRLAAEKPVVTQVGTLAASAGYMIASASDHIVARQSSIVGSIGVLVQFPDVTGLMDKLGIKLEEVKSSPLKAEPSPFNPTTDEERAMIRRMILDSYDWFVDLVTERRGMPRNEVLRLADGSIFTGRQALANKLIDELGGEREAIAWLGTKGVDADLRVVEWKKKEESSWFSLLSSRAGLTGHESLSDTVRVLLGEIGGEHLFLDGMVSLWHPAQPSPDR